jgi:hypothetical protein
MCSSSALSIGLWSLYLKKIKNKNMNDIYNGGMPTVALNKELL